MCRGDVSCRERSGSRAVLQRALRDAHLRRELVDVLRAEVEVRADDVDQRRHPRLGRLLVDEVELQEFEQRLAHRRLGLGAGEVVPERVGALLRRVDAKEEVRDAPRVELEQHAQQQDAQEERLVLPEARVDVEAAQKRQGEEVLGEEERDERGEVHVATHVHRGVREGLEAVPQGELEHRLELLLAADEALQHARVEAVHHRVLHRALDGHRSDVIQVGGVGAAEGHEAVEAVGVVVAARDGTEDAAAELRGEALAAHRAVDGAELLVLAALAGRGEVFLVLLLVFLIAGVISLVAFFLIFVLFEALPFVVEVLVVVAVVITDGVR
mmetsp:Transcript_5143/g.16332  ORF Transcript_5143/g.16332 Transcript_5143/m.16332 type:complete len:327 (+) Transcript_5143:24-1004(+)